VSIKGSRAERQVRKRAERSAWQRAQLARQLQKRAEQKKTHTMDARHRDSNPGSAEVSKRALPASAGKETQNDPKTLFGGKPAGSVHAPPVEAVLTTTSNEKDSPPRLSPANTTDQQSAQQHATPPPVVIGPEPHSPSLLPT